MKQYATAIPVATGGGGKDLKAWDNRLQRWVTLNFSSEPEKCWALRPSWRRNRREVTTAVLTAGPMSMPSAQSSVPC